MLMGLHPQCGIYTHEWTMHLGGSNDWPWAGPLLAATPGMFTLTLVLVLPCASLRDAPEHVTKHFQVLVQVRRCSGIFSSCSSMGQPGV